MIELREALLGSLIDDAGLFPPARKPMERAAEDHRAALTGPHGWMLGRFLCPASRVGELRADPDWTLGVVSDGDWRADLDAAVAAGADAFELRDPGPEAYETLRDAPVRVFVERPASLEELAEAELGAKIRCGGEDADAFPTDREVADFISGCRALDLPFKATAGLHHPFREEDPELGLLQHGFVNLLVAAAVDVEHVEDIVAERDPAAFHFYADGLRWHHAEADLGFVRLARTRFTAFGSCSLSEPVEDLVRHGLLDG